MHWEVTIVKRLFCDLIICAGATVIGYAQSNLLLNPSGDEGTADWKASGDPKTEFARKICEKSRKVT